MATTFVLGQIASSFSTLGEYHKIGHDTPCGSFTIAVTCSHVHRGSTNYPVCFLDRQKVLRSLADHVHNQQRVLLNKKVTEIDHSSDRVTVHCADGTSYCGDVVVGADGIWSKVRQEMWRAREAANPGAISLEEKNGKIVQSVRSTFWSGCQHLILGNSTFCRIQVPFRNLILLDSAASRPVGYHPQERCIDAGHHGQRRPHLLVFVRQNAPNLQSEQYSTLHQVRGRCLSPAAPRLAHPPRRHRQVWRHMGKADHIVPSRLGGG